MRICRYLARKMADHGGIRSFSSLTEFNIYMKQYEERTKTKYIVLKSDRAFGKSDLTAEKNIHWKVRNVPYNGTPFKVLGKKTYVCHQGRDKNAKAKRRREEQIAACHTQDHSFPRRRRLVHTKKMNCPASIYVVHIVRFPSYKITEDKPKKRNKASSTLKEALSKEPSHVDTEEIFAAYFPVIEEHKNHPIMVLTNPRRKAKKRQICGRLLEELSNMTYQLQDEPFLDSVIRRITDLIEDVRRNIPHDDTLPLSYTPPSKKMRCLKPQRTLKPLSTIPQRHPFSVRVGHCTEVMIKKSRLQGGSEV
ncbi:hypothetical protein AAFF_G00243280 [Aldrovandia affinis]|uniref:Uncharacterized protein n=1 Tax=Aldrovandia affinis TaxID=143900 RepID=A0AAD7RE08_9TELE|nr:hypothetical protein AAFF_G00243280 [Aldrovandia affinis]